MNSASTGVHEFPLDSQPRQPLFSETRPLYWSIRRELWENRFLYIAPLVVAAVVLFATFINTLYLPRKVRRLEPAKQAPAIVAPYNLAPAPIMLATFLIGMFYSLGALHGERRDRSILFWKSLPVSDSTTVLSKASIPFVVLPTIAFALGVATQVVILLVSTAVLLANGLSAAPLWDRLLFVQEPLIQLYGLTVHVLWFAPIFGWLMLVSAWARRAAFLWAVLPLMLLGAAERIVFHTSHTGQLMKYRVTGAMREAFGVAPDTMLTSLSQLTPLRFLTAPGLWLGLALAAAFLTAAARLRRNREPI